MIQIDNNNYEIWLLRYAENELTQEERQTVEQWLASHPEAAEELKLYNEAPRLQANPSVVYTNKEQLEHRTMPLWPMVLRWSAAAAVLIALIVPALRMGRTDIIETPETPIIAEAENIDTLIEETEKTEPVRKIESPKYYDKEIASTTIHSTFIDSTPSIDSIVPTISSDPIPTNSLIAYEDTPTEATSMETESLIVYDRSADWGDMLLAATDAYRDDLNSRPLGRMVARHLPDNQQLEQNIVEPLREKIDNIKNKIK